MNLRRQLFLGHSTAGKHNFEPRQHQEDIKEVSSYTFFSSEKEIFAFCLAFRALNSFLVQTYFNPDEHWQSLEVAHRIVFGYGHLTWEWKMGIRSYLHPLMFVPLFKVMDLLGLDTPLFMMKAPRLLQSVMSSVGDLYLYKLSRLVFSDRVAIFALFSHLSNWFMFFCITRTLSNCLETVLTIIGLYYWISFLGVSKYAPFTSRKKALFISALACSIRPTSALIWMYIGFFDFLGMQRKFKFLLLEVLPIGIFMFALTCLLDWWMYGSWTFVAINFIKFNFLSSGGDYYGTHVWHWYFTQGFPAMIFTFLPFSLFGILKSNEWKLSGLLAWVLGLYSMLGHKEFRFVLPVLPIALMFSGYSLAALSQPNMHVHTKNKRFSCIRCPSKMQFSIVFLIATNVPMALYMSLVHQRGSEDVMYYLSNEAKDGKIQSILFLMPCHSTAYYSSLHRNLPMRFLDCSPSDVKGVLDESDQFMANPAGFVSEMFRHASIPSHIVLFDSQEQALLEVLTSFSYTEEKRFFHAHFKVDRDLQGYITVYALNARQ